MLVKKLIDKFKGNKSLHVRVYAPAEGYEDTYYKLDGLAEHNLSNKEALGYEFIENDWINELNIILATPIDFTKVTITAHFIDGTTYELHQSLKLRLDMERLYDFWPAHIDCRTEEEFTKESEAEQLTIEGTQTDN